MRLISWGFLLLILQFTTNTVVVVDAGTKKRINFQPAVMSADDVIEYFKSFFSKSSSLDRTNEQYYAPEEYSEDLYHKIDNLMTQDNYIKWLMRTKEITDKTNNKKASLLPKYGNSLNSHCNPSSIFNQTLKKIIQTWDGDKTIVTNELEEWQRLNERVPASELCNRFRGLTCQRKRAINPDLDHGRTSITTDNTTCQCAGDPNNVGFFRPPHLLKEQLQQQQQLQSPPYPDGCYIRPWRPCKHLSAVDNSFKDRYNEWHGSLENDRRILAQMIFPVPRIHRCKQGTYCLDMIPGMNKPICWCTLNNKMDPECIINAKKNNSKVAIKDYIPPLGVELENIRKAFGKLIIPSTNMKTPCNPEYNEQIEELANGAGLSPTKTRSIEIMKKLAYSERTIRVCDFRAALVCDKKSKLCKGNLNCGPGKVHLGKGVCVSDNGYQCQSNEDCVQNARCTYFKEASDSACVCETGYGDECHLQNKPFFGTRFLPMVSGIQGEEYIQTQTSMYKILESWEDSMKLKLGDTCDVTFDNDCMEVVRYFGSLSQYDITKGALLLMQARKASRDASGQLCRYTQFQRCDLIQKKCVPMIGTKLIPTKSPHGEFRITVEIEAGMDCVPKLTKIFENFVTIVCQRGYICEYAVNTRICKPDCNSPFAPKSECKKQGLHGRSGGRPVVLAEENSSDEPQTEESTDSTTSSESPTTTTEGTTTDLAGHEGEDSSSEAPGETEPPIPIPPLLNQTTLIDSMTTTTSPTSSDSGNLTHPTDSTPEPPPPEPGHGSSCSSDAECPIEKFLSCELATKTCVCIGDLISSMGNCEIPLDNPCGKTAEDQFRDLHYNVPGSPACYASECTPINNHTFCRPFNEDGAMFLSNRKLKELEGTNNNTNTDNSNQGSDSESRTIFKR